jgi:hypothetical protein
MVKKKSDNPLAGLKRFNVNPNPVTSATLYSNVELLNDMQRNAPELNDDASDSEWSDYAREEFSHAKKARKEILQGTRSVLNNEQPPAGRTGLEDILGKAQKVGYEESSPERWLPEHFNYRYTYEGAAQEYANEAKKQGGAGRFQSWDAGYGEKRKKKPQARKDLEAAEPWRKTNESSLNEEHPPEFDEWVKGQYNKDTKGTPAPSVSDIFKPGYKRIENFKLSQSMGDMVSENNKTGKVEEPALPSASEKPVAKKKKSEPEYVPSKSEKDFAAGRMPGITGTEAEAAAALAKTRKSSTSKVTGKAKEKLQAEIAAHPDFRGTRQLTDAEVAANEGGATASKAKGKKKAASPVPAPKAKDKSKEKPASEPIVDLPYLRNPNDPNDPADNAQLEKIKNLPSQIAEHNRKIAEEENATTSVPAETKKRNYPNVNDKPAATTAETSAPISMKDKYKDLLGSLTPEQEAQAQADMNAAGDKWEADMNATAAETAAPKASTDGKKFMLNTDKSGVSEPVYGTASEAKANAQRIRQIRSAREGGSMATSDSTVQQREGNFYDWGSETTPSASPSSPSKPGFGARLRGFLGGHNSGRTGGAATPATNAPSAPPSVATGGKPSSATPSTPSAPASAAPQSRSGSFYNISGPVTFGDQTNLGRGDFGTGGSGGGIGINNSANVVFAPQVIGESRFGNVTGGTINPSPTVASTAGRATSTNKNATVLSTGGPASSGQPSHPRAKNAQSSGRPTTRKGGSPAPAPTPTAKNTNPRKAKP